MKKKKQTQNPNDPLRGLRKTGSFTYNDKSYDIMLSPKGTLAFVENGKWVDDPQLQNVLMEELLKANQTAE